MATFKFLVQGSDPQPYETTFTIDGQNISASCSCKAGKMGSHCKHRLNILKGDFADIVSNNTNDAKQLKNLFNQTMLASKITELDKLNKQIDKLKKEINSALS